MQDETFMLTDTAKQNQNKLIQLARKSVILCLNSSCMATEQAARSSNIRCNFASERNINKCAFQLLLSGPSFQHFILIFNDASGYHLLVIFCCSMPDTLLKLITF